MKFPPQFAYALLPVTVIHLFAITLFRVVVERNVESHHFANSGMEAPRYERTPSGTEVIGGIESTLFPEIEITLEKPETQGSGFSDAPWETLSSEVESVEFQKFPAVVGGDEAARPARPISKPNLPAEEKAQPKIEPEPARRVRGFRPIGVKKPT